MVSLSSLSRRRLLREKVRKKMGEKISEEDSILNKIDNIYGSVGSQLSLCTNQFRLRKNRKESTAALRKKDCRWAPLSYILRYLTSEDVASCH